MVMKNLDVISAFLNRTEYNTPVGTDGCSLYSYGLLIARWSGDEIVVPDSTIFHSITTSRHRNMLRREAKSRGQRLVEA